MGIARGVRSDSNNAIRPFALLSHLIETRGLSGLPNDRSGKPLGTAERLCYYPALGSSASRRPSPKRLNASTVSAMAAPGNAHIHQ